jgi:hypothetical protein
MISSNPRGLAMIVKPSERITLATEKDDPGRHWLAFDDAAAAGT